MPGRARVPAGAEPEPRSPRRQRWAEPAPGAHWAPRLALLLYEKLTHAFVLKKKKKRTSRTRRKLSIYPTTLRQLLLILVMSLQSYVHKNTQMYIDMKGIVLLLFVFKVTDFRF